MREKLKNPKNSLRSNQGRLRLYWRLEIQRVRSTKCFILCIYQAFGYRRALKEASQVRSGNLRVHKGPSRILDGSKTQFFSDVFCGNLYIHMNEQHINQIINRVLQYLKTNGKFIIFGKIKQNLLNFWSFIIRFLKCVFEVPKLGIFLSDFRTFLKWVVLDWFEFAN